MSAAGFQPHVSPYEHPPELTVRAVLLGAVLGIVFGASSTYLALRVGLTVSASVPIAVIAIALLRQRDHQRVVLEHNIAQTVGAAGEFVRVELVFPVMEVSVICFLFRVAISGLLTLNDGR